METEYIVILLFREKKNILSLREKRKKTRTILLYLNNDIPLKQTYISQTISISTFLDSARLRYHNGIIT